MIKSKSGWNSTDRIIDFTFRIDQALLEGDTIVGYDILEYMSRESVIVAKYYMKLPKNS